MTNTADIATGSSTFCPGAQRRFVLIAAILASALGFIDGSILSIALPAIRADLGASLVDAQWISNSYALTLSALILVGGAAGDKFGLRRTFAAGIALFIVASAACALAPTAFSLILFRAVQGIGAAIMVPGSLAIIAKAYPKAERGRAIGIWAASSALTTALGPVLGGFLLSYGNESIWRLIFAINLPLGAVAIWLLLARVPADSASESQTLDLGGAALATVSLGAIAYGLTALGAEGEGMSGFWSITALAAGVILLAVFILWELRHPHPMVDLALFRIVPFTGANLSTFFLYFALSAILFYLPMLLIAGWGLSAALVGFVYLPLSAAIALLSGPVGKLSDRIGARLPIALGSLLVALAFAVLAGVAMSGFHNFWAGVFPAMVVMALGMALVVSPLSTAVMTSVDDKDTGAASGINNAVARIAGLVAVAAMGAVASLAYAAAVQGSAGQIPGFGESVQGALDPTIDSLRIAASDSAFAAVAICSAVLSLLSAIAAWFSIAATPAKAGDQDLKA